jgi:hypothetical protein
MAKAAEPSVNSHVKNQAQLFRYATWVHIGVDAEDCEDVNEETGEVSCGNPLHFHAWCRLPNQFQHREIREKAQAARARRARQLRDPSSDSAAVLRDELDALLRLPDAQERLVDELVNHTWWKDYMQAVRDLHEFEDDKGEKPWATVDEDRVRYAELQSLDPAERPAEEFTELEAHLLAHTNAIEAGHAKLTEPRREALRGRSLDDLAEMVRDQRIDTEAQEEFMHVFSMWEWYAGTLRCPAGERYFPSMDAMTEAAPEVINRLQEVFDDLERTLDTGPAKNS